MAILAAEADVDARAQFTLKTKLHLFGAILTFVALEATLFDIAGIENLVALLVGTRWSWLEVLALFVVVSHIADAWA